MPKISYSESDEGYIFIGLTVLETKEDVRQHIGRVLETWGELVKERKVREMMADPLAPPPPPSPLSDDILKWLD